MHVYHVTITVGGREEDVCVQSPDSTEKEGRTWSVQGGGSEAQDLVQGHLETIAAKAPSANVDELMAKLSQQTNPSGPIQAIFKEAI